MGLLERRSFDGSKVAFGDGARMIGRAEWLEAVRACCPDEVAFQQLLALLAAREAAMDDRPLGLLQGPRNAAILDLIPDRIFRVNRDGDNLDFKGTEEDTVNGVLPETIAGTNLRQFLPPAIAQTALTAIAQALETGKLQTFEYQIPKAWEPNAGELREYEVRLVVCGPEEVLAIERDITDRKRAEAALRLSESRNRAFLNAIPDLLFRMRRDGTYLDARADNLRDLAVPPETLLGRTVYDVLPPAVAQQRMYWIEQALGTGQPQRYEYQLVVQGELRDYEARIVVINDEEVLAIMRDITERKRRDRQLRASTERQAELYQQLQQLNASLEQQVEARTAELRQKMQELEHLSQQKDDCLHAVSHDLRTPMMGMRLVLQNLLNKADGGIAIAPMIIERMIQSLDRQLAMIQSLLEAHSSDVQGIQLHYEPVDLQALIAAISIDLAPIVKQHQATLDNQVMAALPPITADPTHLRRVFENLITNALQSNPTGVHICLQAHVKDNQILCTVRDNGVGIAPNDCETLFDRYAQGAQRRRSTGIGLGLYLCRQIITAHGGEIAVTSSLGHGATFGFTLPLTHV